MKKAKLGSGKRFEHLTHELSGKGAKDPKALAAWIGRRKYGASKMAKLSAHGKHKHTHNSEIAKALAKKGY